MVRGMVLGPAYGDGTVARIADTDGDQQMALKVRSQRSRRHCSMGLG